MFFTKRFIIKFKKMLYLLMILIDLLKNTVFSFGKVLNYGNEITHSFIQWEEFWGSWFSCGFPRKWVVQKLQLFFMELRATLDTKLWHLKFRVLDHCRARWVCNKRCLNKPVIVYNVQRNKENFDIVFFLIR